MSEQQNLLNELYEELGLITVDLTLIGDYAKDFPQGGQDMFNKKINNFVLKLDDISKLSKSKELKDIKVPISVFSYIDADVSPTEYNEDVIRNIDRLKNKLKNTSKTLGKLQTDLKTKLVKEFPEDMMKYDEDIQKRMVVVPMPLKNANAKGDKIKAAVDKQNPKNV